MVLAGLGRGVQASPAPVDEEPSHWKLHSNHQKKLVEYVTVLGSALVLHDEDRLKMKMQSQPVLDRICGGPWRCKTQDSQGVPVTLQHVDAIPLFYDRRPC